MKRDSQQTLVSISLLIVSVVLFLVTEIMEGYAVLPDNSRRFVFACIQEQWVATRVLRSAEGALQEFKEEDPGFAGFGDVTVTPGTSDHHDLVSVVFMGALTAASTRMYTVDQGSLEWPVAKAEGFVTNWRVSGSSRLVTYEDAKKDSGATPDYMARFCLPGWSGGAVAGTKDEVDNFYKGVPN